MAAMLDSNPAIDLLSLSPTDGQMWCECPRCRAWDEEGVPRDRSMLRRSLCVYNAVARELRKTDPDARILVGACLAKDVARYAEKVTQASALSATVLGDLPGQWRFRADS